MSPFWYSFVQSQLTDRRSKHRRLFLWVPVRPKVQCLEIWEVWFIIARRRRSDGDARAMASNNAERYRKRAEELRAIALGMPHSKAKQTMMDAAARFDQIAESAKHLGPLSPLFRDL